MEIIILSYIFVWVSGIIFGLSLPLLPQYVFLAKPIRPLRIALQYWRPYRLTLSHNPHVHAWLWWNF